MSHHKCYFLGVVGRNINGKILEVLFRNAYDLIESGEREQFVKGRDYEGRIETDFERVSLVTISGVVFRAELMTLKGECKATFIIRDQDLEGVENIPFDDIPWIDEVIKATEKNPHTNN